MNGKKNESMPRLIIIGASGHGKVIADIAEKCGYTAIAFLDDSKDAKFCMTYPVIGTTDQFNKYKDAHFFVAIGNAKIRENIQNKILENGFHVTTLIHPDAVIASHVSIGIGTVVMAGVIINPESRIGNGCIINTGATVDHDNNIEDFVHISVGSHTAGNVAIGQRSWIGAGAVVSNNVTICADCMIGAGAVVIKDIQQPGTYVGVPVRRKN